MTFFAKKGGSNEKERGSFLRFIDCSKPRLIFHREQTKGISERERQGGKGRMEGGGASQVSKTSPRAFRFAPASRSLVMKRTQNNQGARRAGEWRG